MINNPELIKQVIDNIKKLSKEDLDKVMKETDEWYNKEATDINVGNIEEDIERCKELIKDKHKEWIGLTNQKAIANVLEAYEKLQNKLLDTMKGTKIIREETPEYIRVTYIPKQKIKDKIEELKYRADGIAGTYQYADSQEHLQEKKNKVIELRTKAMALEELLKEEDK